MRYEIMLWITFILKYIPGKIGCAFRRILLPCDIGPGSRIWDNVHIDSPSKLKMGRNSSINRGTVLNCGGGIDIGDNVLIGPNVTIYSQNHKYRLRGISIANQGYVSAKVVIESDVWIASSAVILPGVTVAEGCVIGASTVVTKSTQPYTIYIGVPARKIGERADE